MILDTSALIDLLKANPAFLKKLEVLEQKNTTFYFTSISVFELWQGTSDIEDEQKLEQIHLLLESLGTFSLDIPSAKEAGVIHASLEKEGKKIDPEDSMIAGIAKANREVILTRNVKHFTRVKGIQVESY
ncbi:PIN domain-containing protein [Candidatus Woesearchaeota archaeon]|nr:PIN domain-containing protein [Candidatus Woesearchaeota archaeon]